MPESDYLQEYVVDKQSGSIDGFESFALGADHFDLNKFHSPDDSHYKLVTSNILDFLRASTAYKQAVNVGLQYAADSWDPSSLQELLALDADPNTFDEYGYSPLYIATKRGDVNAVRVLLDAGADIDAGRDGSYTPLQAAADEGHLAVAQLLVDQGANIEADISDDPRTPLFFAASAGHHQIVDLLLRVHADHEVRDDDGVTPLHAAASMGHLEVVGSLLDIPGINIEAMTNRHKQTPLHHAAQEGRNNIVRVLLNATARVEAKDRHDKTPLRLAAIAGRADVVRTLLIMGRANIEARGKHGYTALHHATIAGQQDVVEALLHERADPDAKAIDGATALHLCRHAGVAMLLIDFGANRNATDNKGRAPLAIADREWNTDVVEVLQGYSLTQHEFASRSSLDDPAMLITDIRLSGTPERFSQRDCTDKEHQRPIQGDLLNMPW